MSAPWFLVGSYGPPDLQDPNDDDYDYAEQLRRTLGQGKANGHVPRVCIGFILSHFVAHYV